VPGTQHFVSGQNTLASAQQQGHELGPTLRPGYRPASTSRRWALVAVAYGDGTIRWLRLEQGAARCFIHPDGKRWIA
jgi:hypothetical protein